MDVKKCWKFFMFVGNGTDGELQFQLQQKAEVLCKQIFYSSLLWYHK